MNQFRMIQNTRKLIRNVGVTAYALYVNELHHQFCGLHIFVY